MARTAKAVGRTIIENQEEYAMHNRLVSMQQAMEVQNLSPERRKPYSICIR